MIVHRGSNAKTVLAVIDSQSQNEKSNKELMRIILTFSWLKVFIHYLNEYIIKHKTNNFIPVYYIINVYFQTRV